MTDEILESEVRQILTEMQNWQKRKDSIYLLLRIFYTICAWFILGMNISNSGFFVSLFLFVFPIFLDSCKLLFEDWVRRWIAILEIGICMIWCLFAILGMFGVFVVAGDSSIGYNISTSKDFIGFAIEEISMKAVWRLLISILAITIIDFACRIHEERSDKDVVK